MAEKSSREKTLAVTYAEVHRYGENGDFDRALKAANRVLHMSPQEQPAFHCKIVSLIHLGRFDEALHQINKNKQLSKDLNFEKAYCYYRLNQHKEALREINDCSSDSDYRLKELKAQVLYRLEEYKESVQIYREIIKNINDDYEEERQTNLGAVLVHCEDVDSNIINDLKDDTYELCYNKACLLISQNHFAEAEKKLRQCEKLCREALEEEDASEEEIDIDLALIRVQLAYVFSKQGRIKEAHQLYLSTLKIKLEDIALVAVASNNVVCINKDQNVFDSKKKMKSATNEALVNKLPSRQRKYIALNNAILSYYINQSDQCNKVCETIETTWPELSMCTKILRALNLIKLNKLNDAVDILKKYSAKDEERLFMQLSCAHIYLMQGDRLNACKILENLGDDSYRPGIVGALITIYLGMGKENTALKVFEKTVNWYKKNKVMSGDLSNMWRQAAEFHIRNGHPRVAANSLEELLSTNNDDKKTVAQLVLACAQFDKKRALELSRQLPSVEEVSGDFDIEVLENSSWLNVKKNPVIKGEISPGTPRGDNLPDKKRKHKKRKGKLPKNYDPKVIPDPERWLPRYERSGYRKKRDRRVKEVIKGSQGTASGQADQYDFTSKVTEQEGVDSPSSSVHPSPKPKLAQQQPKKGGQQKKKNKRR